MLTSQKPSQVYNKLNLDMSSSQPRDVRQARNMKYNILKGNRNEGGYWNNFVDHVQEVTNMLQTSEFVQAVIQIKNTVPSVILYDDNVLDHTRYICCEATSPSILGVDRIFSMVEVFVTVTSYRIFNMVEVFVTVTSYKHQGVIRRDTLDHPIVFGPIFIHGTYTIPVYRSFVSHVAHHFG